MATSETSGGTTPEPDSGLPQGRQVGREAFARAIHEALHYAGQHGSSELIVSDASFWDWPLGERVAIEHLDHWARAGGRFVMLAGRYDEMQRRHPRFVNWRRTWSHRVECWRLQTRDPLEVPSALWTPHWVMHRIDPDNDVFVCGAEPERRLGLRELLDEKLRVAVPGFPASTLGL